MNQKGKYNYKEETLLHYGLVRFSLSIIPPALDLPWVQGTLDRVSFNRGESKLLKLARRSHSQVTLSYLIAKFCHAKIFIEPCWMKNIFYKNCTTWVILFFFEETHRKRRYTPLCFSTLYFPTCPYSWQLVPRAISRGGVLPEHFGLGCEARFLKQLPGP